MRILRLVDSLDLRDGGPPAGIRQLDASLRERGHSVTTMAMSRDGQVINPPLGADDMVVPVRRIGGRALSGRFLAGALEAGKDADVVVIHGFYLWSDVVGWIVARRYRIPLVLQPHGVFERYQQAHSVRSKRVFDAVVGRKITHDLAGVNVASQAEIVGVSDFVDPSKIHVVGIGVALPDVTPRTEPHAPLRLLALSRIAPKKRIDVSIEALSLLLTQGVHATLTVAGTGPAELIAALKEQAERTGVADHVRWAGHITGADKLAAFAEADIYLLPSENENFAISVAEAVASGLPAIVTREVAMSEFVGQGAGRVIDRPDAEALAAAVRELSDPSSYAAASARAIEVAHTELSWQVVADRWIQALQAAQHQ